MTILRVDLQSTLGEFSLQVTEQLNVTTVLGVLGNNGAGKTTLLRLLAGLDHAERGVIEFGDSCWLDTSRSIFVPPHKRRVGMVFQDARLFPHLTVAGNLDFAADRAVGRLLPRREVIKTLGLEGLLARSPDSLSGGERQRVALARALMSAPQLLLLDEPLSAADMGYRIELMPYLREVIVRFKIPTLYVAHTLDELTQLADQLLVLRGGRCAALGSVAEVLAQLDLPEVAGRKEASSVITANVTSHDLDYQLTSLTFGGQSLSLSGLVAKPSEDVRIRVFATDVAIALTKPQGISIRNVLPAIVTEVRIDAGSPFAEVLVAVGGQSLRVRMTRASLDEMNLRESQHVFALLKTASLASD
ncbi:MAG: molybdenum ABC transporter ATP-binding protein [Luminiphilus sp.]|nr:molybdenum ABC transporter ATP-binding protein [Luminiphilus sp.]MDG1460707.1 molybdenum ABC transporter ATP-binding protein [Luminiphilus sp.]